MFHTLLSPVDGSPFSENALPFALNIAARADAKLHVGLVHVPATFGETAAAHWADFDAETRQDEEKYLGELRRRLAKVPRANVEIHHLEGIVPETLAEEVVERRVDLVVINAHGWGYMSRSVVGSVSDYLMRHLQVPLLVVHASQHDPELSRPIAFRRVLLPLDGSPLAERIVGPARELGGLWEAQYRLLRVVAPPRKFLSAWSDDSARRPPGVLDKLVQESTIYLEGLAQRLRGESLTVETQVVIGQSPAQAILDEARAADCDVIAIATRGRSGLPRLLQGSVADKVIRGAHTPVLVCNAS